VACLGRDLWRKLVAVVEAETWQAASVEEDSVDEDDQGPEIDEAQPRDYDADNRCPGRLDLAALPVVRTSRQRWHRVWDEDVLWGDLNPESRRRLKRLLGGDLK
jgi:hypothetical protein